MVRMKPISKLLQLVEKRSHPELNPKVSGYTALAKYKNDPNIYISYTDIPKIGINPKSSYKNTPLGIYAYPLVEMYKKLHNKPNNVSIKALYKLHNVNDESGMFAASRPYVFILRSRNKPIFMDMSNYTEDNYNKDMDKLRKLYEDRDLDNIINHGRRYRKPISKMWNVTKLLALTLSDTMSANMWNGILRKLGYSGFVDSHGSGIIHPNEPTQAVFLTKDAFEVVDMLKNINPTILKNVNPNIRKMFKTMNPNYYIVLEKFPWLAKGKFKDLEVMPIPELELEPTPELSPRLWISGGTWLSGTFENANVIYTIFKGGMINAWNGKFCYCSISNTIINNGAFFGKGTIIKNCTVNNGVFGTNGPHSITGPIIIEDSKISNDLHLANAILYNCTKNGKEFNGRFINYRKVE